MPRSSIACIYPSLPHLATTVRIVDPVLPWGRGLAVCAIGQAAGTMGCALARAIIRRMRFPED